MWCRKRRALYLLAILILYSLAFSLLVLFPTKQRLRFVNCRSSRSRSDISHSSLNVSAVKKSRYLVFQAASGSGGWGDRFRGMASAYALAQFADRDFRVHFLDEPFVNWRAGLLPLAFDNEDLFSGTQLTGKRIDKSAASHNQVCLTDYKASRIARNITFQACTKNCFEDDICNGVSWDAGRKLCIYCASAFPNCGGRIIGTSTHSSYNTYWKQYDSSEIDVYSMIDGQILKCFDGVHRISSHSFSSQVLASKARVVVLKTNENLFDRIVWDWAASQLLASMQIKKSYLHTLSELPVNISCGQYRLGASANVGDSLRIVSEKKESIFYENLMQWMLKAGNAPVHLWTDSEKVYLQFKKTHSNAINITGPILHIDKTTEISSEKKVRAFKRVIIEWLLVSRCSRISQQTGFINTALFNAQKGAKIFRHYFG